MEQMTPLLIGHYRSIADVAYYSFSLRLLQYGTDAVSRVGVVVTPQSAEMAARREFDQVGRLAMFASRYCLILFMPIAIFLGMFGHELLGVWLRKPDFAANSAPLLRPMLVGFTLAQAAQFCSASILFGLGAQQGYAVTLVAELALNIVATILVLPSYGIMGAAVVTVDRATRDSLRFRASPRSCRPRFSVPGFRHTRYLTATDGSVRAVSGIRNLA
jgi:O-antigen/teichoic acid export membrane protein